MPGRTHARTTDFLVQIDCKFWQTSAMQHYHHHNHHHRHHQFGLSTTGERKLFCFGSDESGAGPATGGVGKGVCADWREVERLREKQVRGRVACCRRLFSGVCWRRFWLLRQAATVSRVGMKAGRHAHAGLGNKGMLGVWSRWSRLVVTEMCRGWTGCYWSGLVVTEGGWLLLEGPGCYKL